MELRIDIENIDYGSPKEQLMNKRNKQIGELKKRVAQLNDQNAKAEMTENLEMLEKITLSLDMNQDLQGRQIRKKTSKIYDILLSIFEAKHIRLLFITFIFGLLTALIPSLMYTYSLKNNTPEFKFVPNSIGYPKSKYVQLIKTEKQLKMVQESSSLQDFSKEASIGALVTLNGSGLMVLSQQEVSSPDHHIKDINIQENKRQIIDGYPFVPNAILERDPRYIQIMSDSLALESARKDKNLLGKNNLEVGAAIHCPQKAKCFVIPKPNLTTNYKKVEPIYTGEESTSV